MFSLSEGPQQSTPTAVTLAATAPAVAGSIGGSVFPAASAGMMAGAPAAAGTSGAATSAPAVAGSIGGSVFPAASAGMMVGTPATAGSSGAAFPAASSAVKPPPAVAFASDDHENCQVRRTATAMRRQAYEVTTAMTRSRSWSSSRHDGVSGASTHPFDPGTVFPLEFCYYKGSWLQHGSSSSSKSNSSSSSSSNSSDSTSNHGSWWDVTCVEALLRPFDPGKRYRRSARMGKVVLGLDLPFDRGRAWR